MSGPTDRAAQKIARARFAIYGTNVYPDATFTLRLSYGKVQGWNERGTPVPQADTARASCLAPRAAVIDQSQGQQTPHLIGVLRLPRQLA